MKQWKRLVYYLLINVLVSACTTVVVLYFWDRTHPPAIGGVQPVAFNALRVGIGAAFADGNHLLHTADIGRTCFNSCPPRILTPTRRL